MQYFVPIIFISGSVKEKKEVQNKTTKTILQGYAQFFNISNRICIINFESMHNCQSNIIGGKINFFFCT
jgi:hypothetical protein